MKSDRVKDGRIVVGVRQEDEDGRCGRQWWDTVVIGNDNKRSVWR